MRWLISARLATGLLPKPIVRPSSTELLLAYEAIEAGSIAESVEHLAKHEQRNILQSAL